MTIARQGERDGNGGEVRVTFRFTHATDVDKVCVVGEFNDWSTTSHPMERRGEDFVAEVSIPAGRAYRFRYLLDDERWENDWAADSYVPNEFGGDDSVLDLSFIGPAGGGGVAW